MTGNVWGLETINFVGTRQQKKTPPFME